MAGIFDKLSKAGRPSRAGRRFQDRYDAARAARKDGRWGKRALRVLRLLFAVVAGSIGVVLAFIPGPAIPFFILAGGLLSAESRGVARLLDWGEVKLRAGWSWGRRLPAWGQLALAGLVVGLSLASAYASYRIVMN